MIVKYQSVFICSGYAKHLGERRYLSKLGWAGKGEVLFCPRTTPTHMHLPRGCNILVTFLALDYKETVRLSSLIYSWYVANALLCEHLLSMAGWNNYVSLLENSHKCSLPLRDVYDAYNKERKANIWLPKRRSLQMEPPWF